MNTTLVYFGAGFDRFSKVMEVIDDEDIELSVFVDALPKIPHYTSNMAGYKYAKDEVSFTRKITKELKRFGYRIKTLAKDVIVFKRDNKKIIYVYNHTSKEAALSNIEVGEYKVGDIINNAEVLYLQGYDPFEMSCNNEPLTREHIPSIYAVYGYYIHQETIEYIEDNYPDVYIEILDQDSDFDEE